MISFLNSEKIFIGAKSLAVRASIKSFFNFSILNKKIQDSVIFKLSSQSFQNLPRPLSKNQIKKLISEVNEEKNCFIKKRNKAFIIMLWGNRP